MESSLIGIVPNYIVYIVIGIIIFSIIIAFLAQIWKFILILGGTAVLLLILDRMGVFTTVKTYFEMFNVGGAALKQVTISQFPQNKQTPTNSTFSFDKVTNPKVKDNAKSNLAAPDNVGELDFSFEAAQIPAVKPQAATAVIPQSGELCFTDDCAETPKPVVKPPVPVKQPIVAEQPQQVTEPPVTAKPVKASPFKKILNLFQEGDKDAESPPIALKCTKGEVFDLTGAPFPLDGNPQTAMCVNGCVAEVEYKDPKRKLNVGSAKPLTWFDMMTIKSFGARHVASPFKDAVIIKIDDKSFAVKGKYITTGDNC